MMTNFTNRFGQRITLGQLVFRTAVYGLAAWVALLAFWAFTVIFFLL